MNAGIRYFHATQEECKTTMALIKTDGQIYFVCIKGHLSKKEATPLRSLNAVSEKFNREIEKFTYVDTLFAPDHLAKRELSALSININLPSYRRLTDCIDDLLNWKSVREKRQLDYRALTNVIHILQVFESKMPKEWLGALKVTEIDRAIIEMTNWLESRKKLKLKTKSVNAAIQNLKNHRYCLNEMLTRRVNQL